MVVAAVVIVGVFFWAPWSPGRVEIAITDLRNKVNAIERLVVPPPALPVQDSSALAAVIAGAVKEVFDERMAPLDQRLAVLTTRVNGLAPAAPVATAAAPVVVAPTPVVAPVMVTPAVPPAPTLVATPHPAQPLPSKVPKVASVQAPPPPAVQKHWNPTMPRYQPVVLGLALTK